MKKEDREKTPWVIVHRHRRLNCSCDGDCDSPATTVREDVEELFYKVRTCESRNGNMRRCILCVQTRD